MIELLNHFRSSYNAKHDPSTREVREQAASVLAVGGPGYAWGGLALDRLST